MANRENTGLNDSGRGPAGRPAPRYYHGTREALAAGSLLPAGESARGGGDGAAGHVYLTPKLDEAIWDAELAPGEGPPRVYTVEPAGVPRPVSELADHQPPGHPSMSCYTPEPVRVTGEVTQWPLYHGTRAALQPGDLIKPGHDANFGRADRTANFVYLARTLDAAVWGAELARGDGPGRIYTVEPTGLVEDDPNLTDQKFRGNPTKSFRSREPLRVTGEILEWQGHPPELIEAMREGLARLEEQGIEPMDD